MCVRRVATVLPMIMTVFCRVFSLIARMVDVAAHIFAVLLYYTGLLRAEVAKRLL